MKYRYFLFLLYVIVSSGCAESTANNDWLGEWKFNDKNKYMSFTISNSDKVGMKLSYDEGIGINGIRINGVLNIIDENIAFVNTTVRGESCKLNLQLLNSDKNKIISLSNCELMTDDEEPDVAKNFVPKNKVLYYKTGFNCAKAVTNIEFAICESKIIAASDRKLGVLYTLLRKSLSVKNKKRLRKEQVKWIKKRNSTCSKQSKNELDYCLRRYYGKRLIALNILQSDNVWLSGAPSFAMFQVIKQARKNNVYSFKLDNGLGLWLGGVIKRPLTDTGTYDVDSVFSEGSVIFSGRYNANPNKGFDPRSVNNKIFIEFSNEKGIWLALALVDERLIYIPKGKSISTAPEKTKAWIRVFDDPDVVDAF